MSDVSPPDQEPDREPAPAPEPDAEQTGRRTTVLIVAAAVVLLAAIGVGIYLVATSGGADVAEDPSQPEITGATQPEPPSSSPPPPASSAPVPSPPASQAPPPADRNVAAARTAAERAATAINQRDIAAMRQLSCDPSTVGTAEEFPPRATVRLAEPPRITGDRATAQIELSIAGSEPTVVPLPLEKRGGKWCVP